MTDKPQAERVRLSIIDGLCIGAGNCVDLADSYFDQNEDDATVILLRDLVSPGDEAEVRRAVNACPVAALKMTESE